MSIQREFDKAIAEVSYQSTAPTTGQKVWVVFLGVAVIVKSILVIALMIFMAWALWSCAGACEEASSAVLPMLGALL